MSDLDRFVTEENVARFFGQLDGEVSADLRVQLSTVLLDEEDSYCRLAGRVDQLEFYISRCDAHIGNGEKLLGSRAQGRGREHLQTFVRNMLAIRDNLRMRLAEARRDLRRLPKL